MSQNYASAGILDPVGKWLPWTVAFVDFTLDNGTIVSRYTRIGDTIHVYVHIVFGSGTTIDGTGPTFSMPVTARTGYDRFDYLGEAQFDDAGTEAFKGTVRADSTTTFEVEAADMPGTYLTAVTISASVPMTWAVNDVLAFEATYEAAPV